MGLAVSMIDGERKDGSSGQYDQIRNARLSRGLYPDSIPSEELAASLGYMVQLLNLVVHNVAALAFHNSCFAFCFRVHAPEYGNETLIGMPVCLPEAMNIHYLYGAKIVAPLVERLHGLIEAQAILVLLQWNLRGRPIWILLAVASIFLQLHHTFFFQGSSICFFLENGFFKVGS